MVSLIKGSSLRKPLTDKYIYIYIACCRVWSVHSTSLGRCHPVGQTPCTPLGLAVLLAAEFMAADQL